MTIGLALSLVTNTVLYVHPDTSLFINYVCLLESPVCVGGQLIGYTGSIVLTGGFWVVVQSGLFGGLFGAKPSREEVEEVEEMYEEEEEEEEEEVRSIRV